MGASTWQIALRIGQELTQQSLLKLKERCFQVRGLLGCQQVPSMVGEP